MVPHPRAALFGTRVGEKERDFVPVGVKTNVSSDSTKAASAQPASVSPAEESVSVSTNPDGADVYVDNHFYGNSPATLKLTPGKHTVTVKMSGYSDWSRDLTTEAGTEAHLNAVLEKATK